MVLLESAATHSVLTVLGVSFCSHRVLVRDVQGRKDTFPTAPVINTTSATMEKPTCTPALEGWCLLLTRADAPGLKRQTGRVVGPRISLNFPALRLVQVNTLAIQTLQIVRNFMFAYPGVLTTAAAMKAWSSTLSPWLVTARRS